jgi:hypothetical protein
MRWKMCIYKCILNVYKNQQNRQTGSRNLMGSKTLPTIWGTYMKLVTKYQISAINSCWEKCDEKCAYMFNVYKKQLSWQTGSRNLTGPKSLPQTSFVDCLMLQTHPEMQVNDENDVSIIKGGGGYTVLPLSVRPSVRPRYFSSHFSQ